MKTLTKTISPAIVLGLAVSAVGCSGTPMLAALSARQHVPSDGVVLAPNEKVTLNAFTAKRREYFCSDGATLQCERIGVKLFCACPGTRSGR